MLLVIVNDSNLPIGVAASMERIGQHTKFVGPEWKSYSEAEKACQHLNTLNLPEGPFIVTYDTRVHNAQGESAPRNIHIHPAPVIGHAAASCCKDIQHDEGIITKVSGNQHKIISTSSGSKFIRKGMSNTWVKSGTHSAWTLQRN